MHFTYIANNFFAKDAWGTWDSVAEGQCTRSSTGRGFRLDLEHHLGSSEALQE